MNEMLSNLITLLCVLYYSHPVFSESDDVLVYTKENFSKHLDTLNNFVMFYAPWCSYCKEFSPVWNSLAKDFNKQNHNLAIAKVDCTLQTELCSDQDITGYPTLKIYLIGQTEGTKFKGTRDIPSLKKFIRDEIGDTEQELNEDADVLFELTDKTFEEHLSTGNHFVKFYAPWCGHCQKLAPTWHKLANQLAGNKDIRIAKVDCTNNQELCSNFEVISYPTLLWIRNGKKIDMYRGSRILSDLMTYVSQILHPIDIEKSGDNYDGGDEENDTVIEEKSVIVLNSENFHYHIDSGFTFVKFFAPWCGHCKRLASTWEELAQKLSDDNKIEIAHVDCTLEENKELCHEQEVEGYPTLFFYHNGVKVAEYNGTRVLEDLLEFVKRFFSHDEL